MNAKRVAAAAQVICESQKRKQTAAGIAADLEATCMLQSPESAAELVSLKASLRDAAEQVAALESDLGGAAARVAELKAERHSTNEALDDAVKALRVQRDRIAELEARLHAAAMTRTWTNEDGKKFVFVEDIAEPLLGRSLPDPLVYGPTGVRCGCGKDAHSNLVPCRQPEDPHDGPLASRYAIPHDLPTTPTAGSAL
ncbi:hypothetical protein [Streptomyces zaomyceticus]|uniref:hypothetical protein n=1 Tax=Streptomyces zaomyceticus TaxID=68286 RepID=UPI00379CE3F8